MKKTGELIRKKESKVKKRALEGRWEGIIRKEKKNRKGSEKKGL